MTLQPALVLRYCIKHSGDTVGDIVADDISHVESGDNHTDSRKKYIKIVPCFKIYP